MKDELTPCPTVAVVGGAVAGAQVANILADGGARVVVFEQRARPFGKIEDGLPRWHSGLRNKEFERIQGLLDHERIWFVPMTEVGRDIDFSALVYDWGFSAVVLASGVWRDRPLPIPNADRFVGRGLIYQNPFIMAFNHAHDPGYAGPRYHVPDGAIVVGGGLASIDVVKVLMLENVRSKLAERGIEVDLEEMEKAGIPKTCAAHGLAFEELGLRGATLVYRRRAADMPVASAPEGADAEGLAKVRASREKILARAQSKFLFRFEALASPEEGLVESGRLVGLRLRRMAASDEGKLTKTDETFDLRGSAVVSSIGSIPEPIPGVAMRGELIAFLDGELGRIEGLPTVFSAGNVVTGKGNIIASRRHAKVVGEQVARAYLGLDTEGAGALADAMETAGRSRAAAVAQQVMASAAPVSAEARAGLNARVSARQADVGYQGDLRAWIASRPPPQ
ncbi:MAG: hypothetical protein AAFZ18_03540 [Myxococcota bacterium]